MSIDTGDSPDDRNCASVVWVTSDEPPLLLTQGAGAPLVLPYEFGQLVA
jgi:hypothetical protein